MQPQAHWFVRRATLDDLPDIYSFELAYIEEIEPDAAQQWRSAIPALLKQWIGHLPRMFVALHGTQAIGHCFWQVEAASALLASLYVVPAWRRLGCGGALLRHFEDDALAQGFTQLSLGVYQGNPASALYMRAGYRLTHQDAAYDHYAKTAAAPSA